MRRPDPPTSAAPAAYSQSSGQKLPRLAPAARGPSGGGLVLILYTVPVLLSTRVSAYACFAVSRSISTRMTASGVRSAPLRRFTSSALAGTRPGSNHWHRLLGNLFSDRIRPLPGSTPAKVTGTKLSRVPELAAQCCRARAGGSCDGGSETLSPPGRVSRLPQLFEHRAHANRRIRRAAILEEVCSSTAGARQRGSCPARGTFSGARRANERFPHADKMADARRSLRACSVGMTRWG